MKKLGVKPEDRLAILDAPPGFALDIPDGVTTDTDIPAAGDGKGHDHWDLVLFFTTERNQLERRIDRIGQVIAPAGAAWIAWPKRAAAARMATDMTEDVVRAVALPRGLVDVKVCAIDDTWSGLKLVWRRELR